MKKKIKIYLGWTSTGQREDVQLYLMRDLQERYGELIELVLPDMCVHRMFHDAARCAVVDEFLQTDCDILWFLDSDVVPPTHVLDLVAHSVDKWQIAGAAYPVYMPVPGTGELSLCFTVYKGISDNPEGRGIFMGEMPEEGTEFVDGLATGCLFIKREVFAKLKRPFFEFKFDAETRRIKEGEDLGFALKCHDAGIKFYTDYGMVCKHFKRVCLLDMNNYAINMSNVRNEKYGHLIKEQVDQAVKAAYEAGIRKGREQAAPPKPKSSLILPDRFARN